MLNASRNETWQFVQAGDASRHGSTQALNVQMQVHVFLFLCRAEFSGRSEIPYSHEPDVGSEHDCILFVAQQSNTPDHEAAHTRLARHGWINARIERVGSFKPESANSQQWQAFQRNYQECLEHGDSIAWYA